MTMAAVCGTTSGKVTGDVTDVAGLILARETYKRGVTFLSTQSHMIPPTGSNAHPTKSN